MAARPGTGSEPGSGLVVELVAPASAAEFSGFQPGDRLLRWEFRPRDPAMGPARSGTLDTSFDLIELFVEWLPRGELTFEGVRHGRSLSWTYLSTGGFNLGLEVRPVGSAGLAAPAGSPRRKAWSRTRAAEAAARVGATDATDRLFREASGILLRASDPAARAAVLLEWAHHLDLRGEPARAQEMYDEALAQESRREGGGLSAAFILAVLAYRADRQGDLEAAERAWLSRLALLEKIVPESLEVASALDWLGYLALWRGDTAAAQERLNRTEAILRPVAATHLSYPATLNKLALVAQSLGDLERAEALQRQVLALNQQLVPGSQHHGGALMNLASTLILRGELASAEELLRQSVELIDQPGSDPQGTGGPYFYLGLLGVYRGDFATAQLYFELALDRMRNDPESVDLAGAYVELAGAARKQRRLADARAWEERALAIYERLELGSLGRSARLQTLARIERDAGDLVLAEALLRQAEVAVLETAPEGSPANPIRRDPGRLLAQTGRPAEAETRYRQVLSNLEEHGLANTKEGAEIHNLLGQAQRQRGKRAAAEQSFCQATRMLDSQRSRLGGSLESRSWFESETHAYFFDCLSALAERRRSAAAFHALESGKTRVFLQFLAERDLRFAGLPPELRAERARLDAEYDRVLSRLAGADGGSETAGLRTRLEEIKAAREAHIGRLRQQSPRLAALQAPEPLELAEARRVLDVGTTLLAYAVGPEWSYLFVVRPEDEAGRGLEVHRLPIGRVALEKEVETYRRLVIHPGSDLETLNARASRLYDLLVKPAEKRLTRARRILIAADGPLHLLPWAALRRRDQYLAQWRPLHLTASMTAYQETLRSRRSAGDPGTWRLVAIGDPRYPAPSGATFTDSEVRSALRRGLKLEPLPATREEIREIAALFPAAEVYLGEEATEERAKRESAHADLLHFAGHGLTDERFPLDSALALSIPLRRQEGQDNGLLQAWEIFEHVRLDAYLVTLSACDTALGREMGGEGLLGLTRAFQFAGARSVLASLWSVSDDSTARLMKRFYIYLREGRTKDEALRAAHLDLILSRENGFSHPYHWAGFVLYGDWR